MKKCKYCNAEIPDGLIVCSECKPFVQTARLSAKVGITEGTLKDRYQRAVEFLWKEYSEGKSSVDIHKDYSVSANKLFEHFRRFGKEVRSHREAQQIAISKHGLNPIQPPKYKSGYHTSWQGRRFWCRSSYEFEFASYLDSLKIPYEVEKHRFWYYDTFSKSKRLAVPDFYLPSTNELVEIKSSYTLNVQNMRDKFKEYRKQGFNVKLLVDGKEMLL